MKKIRGKQLKVNGKVTIDGTKKITNITTKYDENTDKPYKFIWCKGRAFHDVTEAAFNPPIFHYIF